MWSRREGGVSWWGAAMLLGFAAVAMHALLLAAGLIKAGIRGQGVTTGMALASSDMVNLALAQGLGMGLAVLVGVRWLLPGVTTSAALGVRPVSTAVLALALLAGAGLQFPLAELSNTLQVAAPSLFGRSIEEQRALQRILSPESWHGALVAMVAVVVVAPATEETLFRGLLLRGLTVRYGALPALGLSSALFGVMHVEPIAVVYATVAGFILGWTAAQTGSLLPSLSMHAATNSMPLLLPERVLRIRGFNTVGEDVSHLPAPLVLGGAVVAAVSICMIAMIARPEER